MTTEGVVFYYQNQAYVMLPVWCAIHGFVVELYHEKMVSFSIKDALVVEGRSDGKIISPEVSASFPYFIKVSPMNEIERMFYFSEINTVKRWMCYFETASKGTSTSKSLLSMSQHSTKPISMNPKIKVLFPSAEHLLHDDVNIIYKEIGLNKIFEGEIQMKQKIGLRKKYINVYATISPPFLIVFETKAAKSLNYPFAILNLLNVTVRLNEVRENTIILQGKKNLFYRHGFRNQKLYYYKDVCSFCAKNNVLGQWLGALKATIDLVWRVWGDIVSLQSIDQSMFGSVSEGSDISDSSEDTMPQHQFKTSFPAIENLINENTRKESLPSNQKSTFTSGVSQKDAFSTSDDKITPTLLHGDIKEEHVHKDKLPQTFVDGNSVTLNDNMEIKETTSKRDDSVNDVQIKEDTKSISNEIVNEITLDNQIIPTSNGNYEIKVVEETKPITTENSTDSHLDDKTKPNHVDDTKEVQPQEINEVIVNNDDTKTSNSENEDYNFKEVQIEEDTKSTSEDSNKDVQVDVEDINEVHISNEDIKTTTPKNEEDDINEEVQIKDSKSTSEDIQVDVEDINEVHINDEDDNIKEIEIEENTKSISEDDNSEVLDGVNESTIDHANTQIAIFIDENDNKVKSEEDTKSTSENNNKEVLVEENINKEIINDKDDIIKEMDNVKEIEEDTKSTSEDGNNEMIVGEENTQTLIEKSEEVQNQEDSKPTFEDNNKEIPTPIDDNEVEVPIEEEKKPIFEDGVAEITVEENINEVIINTEDIKTSTPKNEDDGINELEAGDSTKLVFEDNSIGLVSEVSKKLTSESENIEAFVNGDDNTKIPATILSANSNNGVSLDSDDGSSTSGDSGVEELKEDTKTPKHNDDTNEELIDDVYKEIELPFGNVITSTPVDDIKEVCPQEENNFKEAQVNTENTKTQVVSDGINEVQVEENAEPTSEENSNKVKMDRSDNKSNSDDSVNEVIIDDSVLTLIDNDNSSEMILDKKEITPNSRENCEKVDGSINNFPLGSETKKSISVIEDNITEVLDENTKITTENNSNETQIDGFTTTSSEDNNNEVQPQKENEDVHINNEDIKTSTPKSEDDDEKEERVNEDTKTTSEDEETQIEEDTKTTFDYSIKELQVDNDQEIPTFEDNVKEVGVDNNIKSFDDNNNKCFSEDIKAPILIEKNEEVLVEEDSKSTSEDNNKDIQVDIEDINEVHISNEDDNIKEIEIEENTKSISEDNKKEEQIDVKDINELIINNEDIKTSTPKNEDDSIKEIEEDIKSTSEDDSNEIILDDENTQTPIEKNEEVQIEEDTKSTSEESIKEVQVDNFKITTTYSDNEVHDENIKTTSSEDNNNEVQPQEENEEVYTNNEDIKTTTPKNEEDDINEEVQIKDSKSTSEDIQVDVEDINEVHINDEDDNIKEIEIEENTKSTSEDNKKEEQIDVKDINELIINNEDIKTSTPKNEDDSIKEIEEDTKTATEDDSNEIILDDENTQMPIEKNEEVQIEEDIKSTSEDNSKEVLVEDESLKTQVHVEKSEEVQNQEDSKSLTEDNLNESLFSCGAIKNNLTKSNDYDESSFSDENIVQQIEQTTSSLTPNSSNDVSEEISNDVNDVNEVETLQSEGSELDNDLLNIPEDYVENEENFTTSPTPPNYTLTDELKETDITDEALVSLLLQPSNYTLSTPYQQTEEYNSFILDAILPQYQKITPFLQTLADAHRFIATLKNPKPETVIFCYLQLFTVNISTLKPLLGQMLRTKYRSGKCSFVYGIFEVVQSTPPIISYTLIGKSYKLNGTIHCSYRPSENCYCIGNLVIEEWTIKATIGEVPIHLTLPKFSEKGVEGTGKIEMEEEIVLNVNNNLITGSNEHIKVKANIHKYKIKPCLIEVNKYMASIPLSKSEMFIVPIALQKQMEEGRLFRKTLNAHRCNTEIENVYESIDYEQQPELHFEIQNDEWKYKNDIISEQSMKPIIEKNGEIRHKPESVKIPTENELLEILRNYEKDIRKLSKNSLNNDLLSIQKSYKSQLEKVASLLHISVVVIFILSAVIVNLLVFKN
ncbi:hypothetical protein QTN25_009532 [Entamoeba marina]